jgi:hypothetical protein
MSVDMSASAIDARLRRASSLASPLRPETRLSTKIDLSAAGVDSRLREASDLLDLCRTLQAGGLSSMARR